MANMEASIKADDKAAVKVVVVADVVLSNSLKEKAGSKTTLALAPLPSP